MVASLGVESIKHVYTQTSNIYIYIERERDIDKCDSAYSSLAMQLSFN